MNRLRSQTLDKPTTGKAHRPRYNPRRILCVGVAGEDHWTVTDQEGRVVMEDIGRDIISVIGGIETAIAANLILSVVILALLFDLRQKVRELTDRDQQNPPISPAA